jgi:tetratricopeptide (TPR) repeat protein
MLSLAELFELAQRYHQSGDLAMAESLYRQILQAEPSSATAHDNLGAAHYGSGQQPAELIECRGQILRINPNHPDALNNLGFTYFGAGRVTEAIDLYRQALRLDPNHLQAHNNLGYALYGQGHMEEAISCFREALRIDPNHADPLNNLGVALDAQGLLAEASNCYRQALRFNPEHVDARSNLGIALMGQGKLAEADECYQKTLTLDPTHRSARWNRSLLHLLHGDYAKGWPDYEQRSVQGGRIPCDFAQPRWNGSALEGKTILLHAEQGLGDTLQFVRFAHQVHERGGQVLLECPPSLQTLLKGTPGVDRVVPKGKPLPAFDVHFPLMSLAGAFETTLATLPRSVPYVWPDPNLVDNWRIALEPLKGFKVGIVWQGNPKQEDDRHRSVSLALFAPLAAVPGVQLISLQVGFGVDQLARVPFPVTDLGSRFDPSSLQDLAAVLPNLDLVVTVCTSVAHLAGALGVPGWVVLKFVPYWCWLLNRSDSPWYPSLRLFRQPRQGAWSEVFALMATSLRDKLKS